MKTEMQKVLNLTKFFSLHPSTNSAILYNFTKSSLIFLHNIHVSWLQSINTKTSRHLPVFTVEKFTEGNKKTLPYGFIANHVIKHDDSTVLEHDTDDCASKNKSQLQLNLIVPHHTSMQYFIQWQRYRKYWWSSVSDEFVILLSSFSVLCALKLHTLIYQFTDNNYTQLICHK